MPRVEGSNEPVRPPDPVIEGDILGKQINWRKHIETYHQRQRNGSISTSAYDSANSSPTTTVSTVDDSSATEMSPGSSPESPMGKPFPSSFSIIPPRPSTSDAGTRLNPPAQSPETQRPATSGRRPRNLKNLAVNTSGTFHMSRAASTTSLPMAAAMKDAADMELANGTFSKPLSPPKRRPTNLGLTIMTPATRGISQNEQAAVPPTPSFTRPGMLRHFQSSPSLPHHPSSKLFDFTNDVISEQQTEIQPPSPVLAPKTNDSEPNFDIPLSKEEKPEAYPDGPICVYGPKLDLYLEPTADQALRYDVVINVASEVRNPFDSSKDVEPTPELRLDGGGGIQYAPRRANIGPQKAALHRDALSPVIESSPSTPKAGPPQNAITHGKDFNVNDGKGPEYIHIPWEHNTDIVPDTLRLVKTIDDRIVHGKRVLIHCQCGVSRSATLVVAYVIYKNPSMSVQEAYDTVKRKSKWIGPNMNLIMQLQEFRTALMRPMARFALSRGLSPISPSVPTEEWGLPGPHAEDVKYAPKTAPLPAQDGPSAVLPFNAVLEAVGPGPSSAPSGVAWPSHDDSLTPARKGYDGDHVNSSGHPENALLKGSKTAKERPHSLNLDSHTRHDSGRQVEPVLSPRSSEFAMTSLQPSKEVESADAYGLMSPTATEFSHSPWDSDALLGALGMGALHRQPRSERVAPPPFKLQESSRRDDEKKLIPLRPKLKPKLSAPSLQEQRKLQEMQSELGARLAHGTNGHNMDAPTIEAALMSPRAFEFTQNPFALSHEELGANGAVSESDDPRSPAQKGVSPITRNIFEVL